MTSEPTSTEAPTFDPRAPEAYLNYSADVRQVLDDPDVPVGPDPFGLLLYPVSAEYDEETGKTRVGFCYYPPSVVA